MQKRERNLKEMFDLEDIKVYMQMSAKDKLYWLERVAKFLHKITPSKNKKIWERLKKRGF